jgi:hypothetical protein
LALHLRALRRQQKRGGGKSDERCQREERANFAKVKRCNHYGFLLLINKKI